MTRCRASEYSVRALRPLSSPEPHLPPDRAPQSPYALAPLFVIRMAGVPFDVLDPLATPRAIAVARELAAEEDALEPRAAAAEAALRPEPDASPDRARKRAQLLAAVASRAPARRLPGDVADEVRAYADAHDRLERLRARHAEVLRDELARAWRALRASAARFLPEYALFASATVEDLASDLQPDGEWNPDRLKDGRRDRTLLMYVQRLATKNETLSAYGPLAWGRIDPSVRGLRLEPRAGMRRGAFFERWVADAVVAAMNAEPAVREEVAPRLHPSARLDGTTLVRTDTGARTPLDPPAAALLARLDGRVPAHALAPPERIAALVEAGAALWGVETPAFVLDRIGALLARVATWRDGEARRRWEPRLAALAGIPEAFERETSVAARRELLGRARALLEESGAAPGGPGAEARRDLYRGSNVLGEKCVRDSDVALGADAVRAITEDAAPWLDLWRDTYAFVAHRVNERLRHLHATVAGPSGAAPLPAFLRAAEAAGVPLAGVGIPALAHVTFGEARAAFREALAGRADAPVWPIGAEECLAVRRRFDFPRFDALTWPSADLQLAARSVEDVAAGRHRWVVAELHQAGAVLQQGVSWSCPDPAAFAPWVRAVAGPLCDWGFPTDLVSHTMLDLSPVEDHFTYVGPRVPPERWRAFRPADAEVVVGRDGDVGIRADGAERGSFARSWVLAFGFHPFVFPLGAHSPRLESGGVVVQREAWVVTRADLPRAPYASGAAVLAADVDRLRNARRIPRHVFVRPTEAALRRLGAGGRDKDVKPIYLDLESYPFLDVLARWVTKHGELDVTEMLPAPEDLLWREEGGRRTFELRTLVVPARPSGGPA